MDTKIITQIRNWMTSTDLVEVTYKKNGKGFSLSTTDSLSPLAGEFSPTSRFIPVAAPAVGIFQWSKPGRARQTEENAHVDKGHILAVIISGTGLPHEVPAPCAGRLAKIFPSADDAVEYGQPLFLIEPKP